MWQVVHLTSSRDSGSRFQSSSECHAIEPAGDRVLCMDRPRFAGEDEERCLEGVLGVVLMSQNTSTNTHDHGAVPIEQRREGIAVAMLDEERKQLPITQSAAVSQERGTADKVQKPIRH